MATNTKKKPPKKGTRLNDPYPSRPAHAQGFIARNERRPPAPKKRSPSLAKYAAGEVYVDNWGHKGQGVRKSTRKAANKALKTMFPTGSAITPQKKWKPVYKRSSAVARPKRKK